MRTVSRTGLVFCVALIIGSPAARSFGTEPGHRIVEPVDFDLDGKVDPAEYSLADGYWRVQLSTYNYTQVALPYGNDTCVPTSGDYDGDGIPEIAAFDTATGLFYTMISGYGYLQVVLDMGAGTEAVRGDYDGDGCDDPTVYDGNTGYWTVRLSTFGYTAVSFPYGNSEIVPVSGDFDGDGKSDIACYRESDGTWWFLLSSYGGYEVSISPFGGPGWSPVTGDFDGDGRTDYGLYSRGDGTWYIALSLYNYAVIGVYGFGGEGYAPFAADFNGDGYDEPAVYEDAERTVTAYYFTGGYSATPDQKSTIESNAALVGSGRSPNGAIGILYSQLGASGYGTNLYYQGYDAGGAALAGSNVRINGQKIQYANSSVVLFDENDNPNLFINFPSGTINQLQLVNNVWSSTTLASGLSISGNLYGCRDANGAFHILAYNEGWDSSEITFVHLTDSSGAWASEVMSFSRSTTMYVTGVDIATGADGTPWIVYGFQDQISQDVYWPGYLYCAHKAGGAWSTELAAYVSHSSYDVAHRSPSIGVLPSGQPVIATWLKYNVITGSDALSQLALTSRSASGSWSSEILASVADDYFGTDGGSFTGLYPDMVIDQNGAKHIIFSDLASSHIGGYESAWVGQIRYATDRYGYWTLSTLLRQSQANDEEVLSQALLMSPDAQAMDIVAVLNPGYSLTRLTNRLRSSFTFQ